MRLHQLFGSGHTHFRVLLDTPGDGGSPGGAAPAGGAPAAPAAQPPSGGSPPAPTPAPQPAGSPAAAPAGVPAPSIPGQGGQPQIPDGYLSREEVNRIVSERVGRVATDRDRYRAMLEAGTGIRQPREVDPQIAEARSALEQIVPELALLRSLSEKYGDRLPEMLDQIPTLAESHEMIWGSHGSRVLNEVYGGAAKALGSETLDEFQQTAIGNTFAAWVRSNPQLGQRYAWGDPNLSKEFLSAWARGFFDPARRMAQAPNAGVARTNAGLPNAPQPSGVIGAGVTGQPANPQTEDQVMDQAWQAVVARQAANVA